MNNEKRAARAKIKAKRNRMERWAHGVSRGRGGRTPSGPRVLARGPGSMMVESDIGQLIDAGRAPEAAAMFEAHFRIRGAAPIRRWGLWYSLYTTGDNRARGVSYV